jgi:formate/nitrite transporter FocA (FNT family)
MAEIFGLDAYSPQQNAVHVAEVGVVKARLPLLSLALLGVLAGAFIGLGALTFTLVASEASLGFAVSRLLGAPLDALALLARWAAVIGGNIVGGSVLVALVYWVIYLRPAAARAPHPPLADGAPPTGDSR